MGTRRPRPAPPMERLLYEVKKIIVGQDHLERMAVAPSPAVTSSSRACRASPRRWRKGLAQWIGGDFKRIQFTPDLVPADLVGTRIYNQRPASSPRRSRGPSRTSLADEINRAPPRSRARSSR